MKYMWDGREISEYEQKQLLAAGITSARPIITQAQVNDAATREWSARQNEAFARIDAKARRDRIAEMALQGLLASGLFRDESEASVAMRAAEYAEALIAELDRA